MQKKGQRFWKKYVLINLFDGVLALIAKHVLSIRVGVKYIAMVLQLNCFCSNCKQLYFK